MDGIRRALDTGEPVTIEYTVEDTEGLQHLEERIVRSGSDEAVGIVRDVTERKRQERQLEALVAEQAALSRVAVAVATERRREAVFNVVTEEVARLFGATWAATVRYETDTDEVTVVGEWHGGDDFELEFGSRFPLDGGAIAQVLRTGRPARWGYTLAEDDYRPPGRTGGARWSRRRSSSPVGCGAATMSMTFPGSFPPDAEERLGKFTSLVAVALLANSEAREELAALADEQAALSRVAVTVATERSPKRVFDVVTEK